MRCDLWYECNGQSRDSGGGIAAAGLQVAALQAREADAAYLVVDGASARIHSLNGKQAA